MSPLAFSVARGVRRLAAPGPHLLVLLPSTERCLALAAQFAARHPCYVTGGPVLEGRFSAAGLREKLRSPAGIVGACEGRSRLPMPVLSFPDQVVGDGDSFEILRHGGTARRWSTLEALLVLRHAPAVACVGSRGILPRFRISAIDHARSMDAFRAGGLPALMALLLSDIARELASPPADWLAGECFALKSPERFEQRIRQELRDIEGLLRMEAAAEGTVRPAIGEMLASVAAARKHSHSARGTP